VDAPSRGSDLVTKGKRRIEITLGIRARPSTVFEALADIGSLRKWFVDSGEIDPRKGGKYSFRWKGGPHHEGEVLEFRPGERLILAWPQNRMRTRVAFHLAPTPGGTVLTFRQTGLDRESILMPYFLGLYSGWVYYLDNLRALVETGRDLRHPADRFW
jgi:uncharacterized protein YndB with AHSA1/START domain